MTIDQPKNLKKNVSLGKNNEILGMEVTTTIDSIKLVYSCLVAKIKLRKCLFQNENILNALEKDLKTEKWEEKEEILRTTNLIKRINVDNSEAELVCSLGK